MKEKSKNILNLENENGGETNVIASHPDGAHALRLSSLEID